MGFGWCRMAVLDSVIGPAKSFDGKTDSAIAAHARVSKPQLRGCRPQPLTPSPKPYALGRKPSGPCPKP
eukprot:6731697-Pyramimonas_sp.AAC.1